MWLLSVVLLFVFVCCFDAGNETSCVLVDVTVVMYDSMKCLHTAFVCWM